MTEIDDKIIQIKSDLASAEAVKREIEDLIVKFNRAWIYAGVWHLGETALAHWRECMNISVRLHEIAPDILQEDARIQEAYDVRKTYPGIK